MIRIYTNYSLSSTAILKFAKKIRNGHCRYG